MFTPQCQSHNESSMTPAPPSARTVTIRHCRQRQSSHDMNYRQGRASLYAPPQVIRGHVKTKPALPLPPKGEGQNHGGLEGTSPLTWHCPSLQGHGQNMALTLILRSSRTILLVASLERDDLTSRRDVGVSSDMTIGWALVFTG